MKIAVAGATGRVGRHVADVAEERGHEVVRMSRGTGVDVITAEGLAEALLGVDVVVDAATGPSPEQEAATEFFTTSAGNLQRYGEQAGVQRLVVVSIVGIDKFSGGYNAAKIAHEQAVSRGPVPVSIVRATQFFEFIELILTWGRQGDVFKVPSMRFQPIAARAVAEAVIDETEHPTGAMVDVAGPQEEDTVDLVTRYVAHRGDDARVEGFSDPADPDSALFRSGALLPPPGARLLGPTFDTWLTTLTPHR